ncbi:MAG TPA: DNA polymerase I [Candidatus Hydrogenedentes bacterium]|nr:DNA polymerase I [Candidatus Hydrogenedentota bacterium]
MADRIFLIDAMAYAFRSYYAIRTPLTDAKGRPTNAVYGFTRVLLKILREHNPAYIAVVFDAPGKSFREEQYPEYKATRQETPQDLKDQFPMMHEVVKALNLPLLVVPGVEADDVIGTLALEAAEKGMEAVIVSGDKDLLQLIGERVAVFDPSKGDAGQWYSREEVVERFGAGPEHVIDALALIGDAADNVPGVHGIGDKTAKKLMEEYGSLEGIYTHLDAIKGKMKERLEQDRDQAFFSRELVTIKTDVACGIAVRECQRKEPDRNTLIDVFDALQFHSLLNELLPEKTPVPEKRDYRLLLTEKEIKQAIQEMRDSRTFAVDTETTSIDPLRADLVGVSLSCQGGKAYYIPVGHTPEALTIFRDPDDLTSAERLTPVPARRVVELIKPILEDPEIGKIGHNIKYDVLVLDRQGIKVRGIVMDTMVASYLTDPSRLRHNLDEVSLQYLRLKPIPIVDLIGRGAKAITFDRVPVDRACEYACEDADLTWRLSEVFHPQLRERGLEALFNEVEIPLIAVLARMEKNGIVIDKKLFDQLRGEIEARLGCLENEIFELAGEPFKINSPKQLQEILFKKIGLKTVRKTKTGYSTDVEVLEELAREHPLPEKILEYRTLEKLRGTYVDALPKLILPETGRIHTSFNQAVAATGRLSSSDPNLQNIPVRTELGRRIRQGFVAGGTDLRLISADYSQIELRILAHLSGDKNLQAAFFQEQDVHRDTAARVFNVPPDAVTPEMRRQAKAVNFGVVYGISPFGLSRNLGISTAQAARFIDHYFAQYPGVKHWLERVIEAAHEMGYVTTLMHRRRYVPELKSTDANTRKAAERAAINTPVQGTAADIIKVAMIRLDAALAGKPARLLLQVHDELLVEAEAGIAPEIAALMKKIMEEVIPLDVPLKVDVGIGSHWAEIH